MTLQKALIENRLPVFTISCFLFLHELGVCPLIVIAILKAASAKRVMTYEQIEKK